MFSFGLCMSFESTLTEQAVVFVMRTQLGVCIWLTDRTLLPTAWERLFADSLKRNWSLSSLRSRFSHIFLLSRFPLFELVLFTLTASLFSLLSSFARVSYTASFLCIWPHLSLPPHICLDNRIQVRWIDCLSSYSLYILLFCSSLPQQISQISHLALRWWLSSACWLVVGKHRWLNWWKRVRCKNITELFRLFDLFFIW